MSILFSVVLLALAPVRGFAATTIDVSASASHAIPTSLCMGTVFLIRLVLTSPDGQMYEDISVSIVLLTASLDFV
jgi:hypothetical protein